MSLVGVEDRRLSSTYKAYSHYDRTRLEEPGITSRRSHLSIRTLSMFGLDCAHAYCVESRTDEVVFVLGFRTCFLSHFAQERIADLHNANEA